MNVHNARIGRQYNKYRGQLSKKDIAIITKIAGEFTNRTRQNIKDWRLAIEAADDPTEPRWAAIQDLYEYLRPDANEGSAIELRKGVTEANKFLIVSKKTKEEDGDKTEQLEKEWFFNLIGDALDHIFYGYSVIQITDAVNGLYSLIPRRNFVPQKRMILLESNGTEGISIDDPAVKGGIIYVQNQYKWGIMNDVVPDLIWKRNARQAWAEFSDKFGLPLMTATTNKGNPEDIARIDAMLEKLGQAARAVLPEGTTLDIKNEAKQGDPYNVFLKQMEYSDAQIDKRFLGGTMVSADGSSRSQAEVHERNLNYILSEKDRRKVEFMVNDQLFPILINAGYNLSAEDRFIFDRSEDLDLKEHWEIVSGLIEKGYNIPETWLSETFNVPIDGRDNPQPGIFATAGQNALYKGFFG